MKSITLKLLIINSLVMAAFVILLFYQTYSRTNERILQVVNQQAALALQFDLSIRQYVGNVIRPAMYELINKDEFFPETMSASYIANSIFEDVRKNFPDYIIKFSSDNPRNPLNQAGPEELGIIEKFNKDPGIKYWEGQVVIDNRKYLAKFSARRMVASCSRCHGDPKDAPASLIERYGDKAGFYRTIGDVVGLDMVAIPVAEIFKQKQSAFLKLSFFSGLGIVLFFVVNILITRYLIIDRLSIISKHFADIALTKDYRQIQPMALKGNDEINDLANNFNIMSERLKESYTFLNEQVDKSTAELKMEIVENMKSEKRLRQSEEKFRIIFKTSPNVMTLTSVEDGIFFDVNDRFSKLLGYSQKDVIGESLLDLNIWNDSKDRNRLASELKKKGLVENMEVVFRRKNGQILNGLMSARLVDIENKKYLLAVIQDITENKETDRAMRLMQYGVDRASDYIFWLNSKADLFYVNNAACQALGYSRKELLSMTLTQIDPHVTMSAWPDRLAQLSRVKSNRFESEHRTKDGRLIPVEIISSYIIFEGKEGILSFVRNITERRQTEVALKESEEKYRNLFETSIDAILLLDPEKGYLDCNPAAFELFGIESKKQLLELTPADLSPKYQPDGSRSSEKSGQSIKKALKSGSNLFEWTHQRLNGEEFFASVLITRLKIKGQTLLQGTIRDISDYKRTQEMMIQNEKMLSVGGLAAGMAHEINNPLAGVMQTADVMSRRLSDTKMPANIRAARKIGIYMDDINAFMIQRDIFTMIKTIKESGRRMAVIVSNMLSFARQNDVRISSHVISEVFDKTLELAATDFDLKKHFDFKMIEIKKEYDPNVPQVPCERAKIQQVLLNILRNGAQAMQEAKVENPLFIIRTKFNKPLKMVCVEIEDNGPGMDEKTMKRVFEPFFTTKPVGVGTGLGLSVSYFIITENHGGEMRVESTPGSGAKFIIRLPLEGKRA
ncbi:MAG: PAS domain S-box protein [Desulfobacula sp.]|nr:PAS domain S-box protein [Desulfobacula sp.]